MIINKKLILYNVFVGVCVVLNFNVIGVQGEASSDPGFFHKIRHGIKKLFSSHTTDRSDSDAQPQNFEYEYPNDQYNDYENANVNYDNSGENADKVEVPDSKKEHGRLDFLGRDIIKGVSKGIGKIEKTLGLKSSSKGLDMNKSLFGSVVGSFQDKLKIVVPGTKWCGDGDLAKDENDLGTFKDTDKCCRQHDGCPDSIGAGKFKYGLENTGLFTRSHCGCDEEFYNCLKNVSSLIATKIGFTYFTVLGPQCFREVPCSREEYCHRTPRGYNVEYEWFDNPTF